MDLKRERLLGGHRQVRTNREGGEDPREQHKKQMSNAPSERKQA